MNSSPSPCIDTIHSWLMESGAMRVGVARVGQVDSKYIRLYEEWIGNGAHGSMAYLEKYAELRADPGLLLPGARSVICCAFAYPRPLMHMHPRIASYALGRDYHDVLRNALVPVAQRIAVEYSAECRVCVDTAPLRERYWAWRSGLGIIGVNNQLIIPGVGSYLFLGEILTTLELPVGTPIEGDCGRCGRCVKACPTGALHADGSVDARRCLSYLTIEHRGEFPPDTDLHGCLYGCDSCAMACPHNAGGCDDKVLDALRPNPEILNLTPQAVMDMQQTEFSTLFKGSAMKRAKLSGLRRNAAALLGVTDCPDTDNVY